MTYKHSVILNFLLVCLIIIGTYTINLYFYQSDHVFIYCIAIFGMYYWKLSMYRELRPSMKTFNDQKFELICFIAISLLALGLFHAFTFIISLF